VQSEAKMEDQNRVQK